MRIFKCIDGCWPGIIQDKSVGYVCYDLHLFRCGHKCFSLFIYMIIHMHLCSSSFLLLLVMRQGFFLSCHVYVMDFSFSSLFVLSCCSISDFSFMFIIYGIFHPMDFYFFHRPIYTVVQLLQRVTARYLRITYKWNIDLTTLIYTGEKNLWTLKKLRADLFQKLP